MSSELSMILQTIETMTQYESAELSLAECTGVVIEQDDGTQQYYEWDVVSFADNLGIQLQSTERVLSHSITHFADQLETGSYQPAIYDKDQEEIRVVGKNEFRS
jgi:hypothetical protein